jgi:GNAT superfamily N-acetyltransferase
METLHGLCRLDKNGRDTAIRTLVAAFMDDPLYKRVLPDPWKRQQFLVPLFRLRFSLGMRYGEVWATSPEVEGIAMWFHSHDVKFNFARFLLCGELGLLFGRKFGIMMRLVRFVSVLEKGRENMRPQEFMVLAPVAVHPEHWGKGMASRLIRPMLSRLDAEGLPCWLATQSERDVSIYHHYGFQILTEGQMPGVDLRYWTMQRPVQDPM